MSATNKQLHWTQRVALVRHNLHAASRSGNFTFFKTIQAAGFMEGTNHVATLSAELGDDADTILAAMDNLNAGLAYVHQNAFQNVYDSLKTLLQEAGDEGNLESTLAKLYVDTTMQRNMADMAVDKMSNSAVALINQQPERVQEQAANVWITGLTLVADSVEVTLQQMQTLDERMDDFIRMEESWNVVKASINSSVAGLRGVFSLMDTNVQNSRDADSSSQRRGSIASASAGVFRRLSNAFAPSASTSRSSSVASSGTMGAHSRSGSLSAISNNQPMYRAPNYVRSMASTGCPTAMPHARPKFDEHNWHKQLSTIPPTPAVDETLDPFDTGDVPQVPPIPDLIDLPKLPDVTASPNVHMGGQQSLIGLV